MISVVICSVNSHLAGQVKANIDNTIGVPWEAIIIDNKAKPRSISAVYNDGARQAKHQIICFVHEDVEFLTNNWGAIIVNYFSEQRDLGMVGVAGACYKSRTISGWMTGLPEFDRYNIFHQDKQGHNQKMYNNHPPKARLQRTVTLDGVFLCVKTSIIRSLPFDERLLKGFHLYDIDISFRISHTYTVAVSYEINLLHFTEGGDYGDRWVENTFLWHTSYRKLLPAFFNHNSQQKGNEYKVKLFWLKRLRKENISFANRCRWIVQSGSLKDVRLWPQFALFFLVRPLSRFIKKINI